MVNMVILYIEIDMTEGAIECKEYRFRYRRNAESPRTGVAGSKTYHSSSALTHLPKLNPLA